MRGRSVTSSPTRPSFSLSGHFCDWEIRDKSKLVACVKCNLPTWVWFRFAHPPLMKLTTPKPWCFRCAVAHMFLTAARIDIR